MLTGAPATGKSTIYHELARVEGFVPVPTETTRVPRPGEVNGLDAVFLSVDQFCERYHLNWYIEPSLEFTLYQGNHYGSPRKYLARPCENEPGNLFISVSIEMAQNIKLELDGHVVWVHLTAKPESREVRLSGRGLTLDQIRKRLANSEGDSHLTVTGCDLILDTSELTLEDCLKIIRSKIS